MNEPLLLDATLIPDPLAEGELGPNEARSIADTDVKGARIQLAQTALERVDIDGEAGLALALAAVFHAPPAARFSYGEIRLRLVAPTDALFVDVAPVTEQDQVAVNFTLSRSGKISLNTEDLPVMPSASVEQGKTRAFTIYHCAVRASGSASRRALWTLSENPDTRQGIGHSTQLALTLRGTGPFAADVLVSARLIKPGLAGQVAAIRDMILGPALNPVSEHRVEFSAPAKPQKASGWFAFLDARRN